MIAATLFTSFRRRWFTAFLAMPRFVDAGYFAITLLITDISMPLVSMLAPCAAIFLRFILTLPLRRFYHTEYMPPCRLHFFTIIRCCAIITIVCRGAAQLLICLPLRFSDYAAFTMRAATMLRAIRMLCCRCRRFRRAFFRFFRCCHYAAMPQQRATRAMHDADAMMPPCRCCRHAAIPRCRYDALFSLRQYMLDAITLITP